MPLLDFSFLGKIIPEQKHKKTYRIAKHSYLNRIRLAMSFFYFGMGFCFASWASRIPDIKVTLQLSEGELGTLLFALPIGQLSAMPFSGKVVTRFGSRKVLLMSLPFYAFCLTNIGLVSQAWQLALALFLFGIGSQFCNISMNTQGVYTEQIFKKPIMGSFHGSWSLAGFCGALVGLGMMAIEVTPHQHFLLIFLLVGLLILANYRHLVKVKSESKEISRPKFTFKMPNKNLFWLGVIGFCCMASEGIMFDWSGVYFKDIVKAPGALVILGYTSFMITMTSGRFLSDILVRKFGARNILIVSGITISTGLYMAVAFPLLIPSMLAFMLVGFGVSNVIPIIYSSTGRGTTIPTGEALTIVTGISFVGFLLGPPVIGHIAELTSLRHSFGFIGIFGVFISVLAYYLKIFR